MICANIKTENCVVRTTAAALLNTVGVKQTEVKNNNIDMFIDLYAKNVVILIKVGTYEGTTVGR